MDQWADDAVFRVVDAAKHDPFYQDLLDKCKVAESKYHDAVQPLSEPEQLSIENYIALCEELQYRMTQLAYRCGLSDASQT